MIDWVVIFSLLIAFISPYTQAAASKAGMTDNEIKNVLQDRVERAKKSVGIVIGVVDENGTRIISYGKPSQEVTETVNGDTVFEIGSVTKVFTALLLADMVERGELNLNDTISKFLPKSVKTPTRKGQEITLLHLVTHTSGLPEAPENFAPKDPENPLADYSVEKIYTFLPNYILTRDIGSTFEYSNVGGALLGHILTLRAGMDYETLVRTRICSPLHMNDTGINLTPKMRARLAHGHDPSLRPVGNYDFQDVYAGAGALRSTANDMLKFISAHLGLIASPLDTAMRTMRQPQHDTGMPPFKIGLIWLVRKMPNTEIVWHNGSTGGYRSFAGFDVKGRKGIVVLSNSAYPIEDIGQHWLIPEFPLAKIVTSEERKSIKLSPNLFDAYVGEYQFSPDFFVKFSRKRNRFFIQATGQEAYEIFAENKTDFFIRAVDAQMTFVKDRKGRVTHLIYHQDGAESFAKKIK